MKSELDQTFATYSGRSRSAFSFGCKEEIVNKYLVHKIKSVIHQGQCSPKAKIVGRQSKDIRWKGSLKNRSHIIYFT